MHGPSDRSTASGQQQGRARQGRDSPVICPSPDGSNRFTSRNLNIGNAPRVWKMWHIYYMQCGTVHFYIVLYVCTDDLFRRDQLATIWTYSSR